LKKQILPRRQLLFWRFVSLIFSMLVPMHPVGAQSARQTGKTPASSSQKLRVATRVVAPFVMQDGSRLQGFSIELWNAIAEQLGVETEYSVSPSVKSLLGVVQAQRADVGIAAISITSERERRFRLLTADV
jgi:polar amino acid transport system substrate-binding protein